jgi:hypothetical protein
MAGLPWPKMRSRVRDLICPALRKRIDFHVTSYRRSHDEAEKAWITVDGERLLTCSWYRHQWHGAARDLRGRLIQDTRGFVADTSRPIPSRDEAGLFLPQDMGQALRDYPDMSLRAARASTNPFIKALSLVDRRIGVRTLKNVNLENDHEFVRTFHRLRMEAEAAARPA